MTQCVISVFGPDRPGIIAQVSGALAQVGANLQDASMSILRGHLAMMITATTPEQVSIDQVRQRLQEQDWPHLRVQVSPVEQLHGPGDADALPYVLSVYGADQPGIVSAMTGVIAQCGGNITDLSTRLVGEHEDAAEPGSSAETATHTPSTAPLYVMMVDVDFTDQASAEQAVQQLALRAQELGVRTSLRFAQADLL